MEIDGSGRNRQPSTMLPGCHVFPIHSPWMWAEVMAAPLFTASAAMKAATWAGEPTCALALSLDSVSAISFDVVIALIAALSLPMMSGGVPAGATTAVQ